MKTYTLDEITAAYKKYKAANVMKVQKQGKYTYLALDGKGIPRIDGTAASIVPFSSVKSFPEYLRENER
jgi:hypothetical protein